jgi:hypothetical protein
MTPLALALGQAGEEVSRVECNALLSDDFSWRTLFAILFVLIFVVPVIQSARLENLRDEAIRELEQKRGSRVIVLIIVRNALTC